MSDLYDFHSQYGVYWLETYEEVLTAVELLKSHGSTITRSIGFDCEGEWLDIKFCFIYDKKKAEPHEDGKNFFDRRIDDGDFVWYGFYEDVSIDELMYSFVYEYDCMKVGYAYFTTIRKFPILENHDDLSYFWFGDEEPGNEYPTGGEYMIFYKNKFFCEVHCSDTLLLPEYHEKFLNSLFIIE